MRSLWPILMSCLSVSRARETDVYFDDASLLEFAVSRLDKDCKVRFVGKGFGTDGYAIGLSKHSWMRVSGSHACQTQYNLCLHTLFTTVERLSPFLIFSDKCF